jgi:ABC-type methionine transport system ATPase subunit
VDCGEPGDLGSAPTGTSSVINQSQEFFRKPTMEDKSRLWLMFPTRLITRPIIWELGKEFAVVTNVRQASVTDEIGLVSLSLTGERDEIKKAIAWLEELGVKVEPVEINTIEG